MIYDDEVLQKINQEADLLAYVQNVLELEQHGKEYFAHCPLHIDKTPSLSFTPSKNSYYCFSCGKAGGMIGYLMDYEGLRFEEAIEKAAILAKIDLNTMCRSETVAFLKKYKAFNENQRQMDVKYIHKILPDSAITKFSQEDVPEWINEGIKPDIIDLFGVRIDNTGNRIVYPVHDIDGNLINVKGRTRYENYKALKLPKYINYYKIGVMDYLQSLNMTLPFIKEKGELIVFESVKSVMKAYGWGYKNCVAAEKHTLTPEQISLIVSLGTNVLIAYDSDINYKSEEFRKNIDKLRRLTNVYVIDDKQNLLGGIGAKNSPVDCGLDMWEELYFNNKRKVV